MAGTCAAYIFLLRFHVEIINNYLGDKDLLAIGTAKTMVM